MTKQQQENIGKLIRKVAGRTPTADLIAFVAANFGMLPACQTILDLLTAQESSEKAWLAEQCHNLHITSQTLQVECERLISIFQPGLGDDEQYRLLGLPATATIAEVKSAFRKLSFRYHPDSSKASEPADSKKFIAICQAYKKIIRAHENQIATLNYAESTPWNQAPESRPLKQKRKTIFLIAGVIFILFLVTFSATRNYRKKAMLKSLGYTQSLSASKQPEKVVPISKTSPQTIKVAAVVSQPASETTVINKRTIVENPPEVIKVGKIKRLQPKTVPSKKMVPLKKSKLFKSDAGTPSAASQAAASLTTLPIKKQSLTERQAEAIKPNEKIQPKTVPPKEALLVKKTETSITVAVDSSATSQALSSLPPLATAHTKPKPSSQEKRPSESPASISHREPISPVKVEHIVSAPQPKPVLMVSPSLPVETLPPVPIPLRNRVENFILAYTNAYESLDFEIFSTFFTVTAKENSISFREKYSKYRRLFSRLKEISYKIKPLSWQSKDDLITIKGRFHAYFLYKNGEEATVHGPVSFILTEAMKVKKLTYDFD